MTDHPIKFFFNGMIGDAVADSDDGEKVVIFVIG